MATKRRSTREKDIVLMHCSCGKKEMPFFHSAFDWFGFGYRITLFCVQLMLMHCAEQLLNERSFFLHTNQSGRTIFCTRQSINHVFPLLFSFSSLFLQFFLPICSEKKFTFWIKWFLLRPQVTTLADAILFRSIFMCMYMMTTTVFSMFNRFCFRF